MHVPASIDDVIVAMDHVIDASIDTGDPRGWFAVVYRAVTAEVRDGIAAGRYDDADRMEAFDVRFANRWLDAHRDHDRGTPVTASWAVSFEAADRPRGLVLQHVLLGMNAHINLDLGVAAAQTCHGDDIAELQRDFERVNDVLATLIDRMQSAIAAVSPMARGLDIVGGRFDEALTSFSLRHARAQSWDFARQLAVSDSTETLIADRDARVAAYGRRIASPGRPLRWLVPLAARRERADMRAVADLLTG